MPAPGNQPRCDVCASKLVKNGTTSAGRTRWRCRSCGASRTQHRNDITRHAQANRFHEWILGRRTQADYGGTGRTFRATTSWCWNIPVPQPRTTGQVHDVVMLDGTYLHNGWCLLVAYDTRHVIAWQWCNHEKQIAYEHLLTPLPPPVMVIVDGHAGALAAITTTWPDSAVQRCFFHIHTAMRRHLTWHPRLPAGKELLALTNTLMDVRDLGQAAAWLGHYATWDAAWDTFLRHRTYASNHRPRPNGVNPNATYWYTHRELRRARNLIRTLIRTNTLFTHLSLQPSHALARTTSPLEGGVNQPLKDVLRLHRGLSSEHARRAIEWKLNSLTEFPYTPTELTRPEHYNPPPRTPRTREEPTGPAGYDTHFSWDDGNGTQHGWAGRSHP